MVQIYSTMVSSTNMLAQLEHLEQNIPEDDWARKMLLKTVQNLSFALETLEELVLRVMFLVTASIYFIDCYFLSFHVLNQKYEHTVTPNHNCKSCHRPRSI